MYMHDEFVTMNKKSDLQWEWINKIYFYENLDYEAVADAPQFKTI